MGLYKEADHFLMELAQKQVQIYPDARDIGIKVSGPKDPLCLKVAEALKEDMLFGSLKQHREETNHSSHQFVLLKYYLPWEHDDYRPGHVVCTEWSISYFFDKLKKVRFMTFIPNNKSVPEDHVYGEDA